MKDYINICFGKLAADADDAAKTAYVENAVKAIAAATGWTANGADLYSPGGNERLHFFIDISDSSSTGTYIACGVYTRYNADADWYGRQPGNWWDSGKITEQNAYATIVKSVSGLSWAIKLGPSPNDPKMYLGVFTNANNRVWIRVFENCNNTYYGFHDGVIETSSTSNGMMCSLYVTAFNAEAAMIIPMPDPCRGSYFIDVFRPVSVTGGDYYCGDIYYANGAYYRVVGSGYMIRIG